MKRISNIGLADVQAVYTGPEGELWELIMGEQIHIGGLQSSMDLAERAGISEGSKGIDLCCCTGAGMRFLIRFRKVAEMIGVDATPKSIERGRERCQQEGMGSRFQFVLADACKSGLPQASADFVWGEDAWCYVVDKPKLIQEAVSLVRNGGTIAFTDWVEGPKPMTVEEAERFLRFMKFPSIENRDGYSTLLREAGCRVVVAENTGRFTPCIELYLSMLETQLGYDALKIIGFDMNMMQALGDEMRFIRYLAREGKIIQGLFVARKP